MTAMVITQSLKSLSHISQSIIKTINLAFQQMWMCHANRAYFPVQMDVTKQNAVTPETPFSLEKSYL